MVRYNSLSADGGELKYNQINQYKPLIDSVRKRLRKRGAEKLLKSSPTANWKTTANYSQRKMHLS